MQQKLTAEIRHHINVVQFEMPKPAHLPFHLLAWTQQYVRVHNCYQFYSDKDKPSASTPANVPVSVTTSASSGADSNATSVSPQRGGVGPAYLALFDASNVPSLEKQRIPHSEVFDICEPKSIVDSYQGPIKVVYLKKFDVGRHRIHRHVPTASNSNSSNTIAGDLAKHPFPAIKYVYYTESDQVVRFDSHETLRALSTASNDTTFFVGKRREKARDSEPEDYMGSLNMWRECGVPGFSLLWPKEHFIRSD